MSKKWLIKWISYVSMYTNSRMIDINDSGAGNCIERSTAIRKVNVATLKRWPPTASNFLICEMQDHCSVKGLPLTGKLK